MIVPAGASTALTAQAVSAAWTVIGPPAAADAPPPEDAAGGAVLVQPARATAAPAVSSVATERAAADLRDMVLLGARRGNQTVPDVVGVAAGAFATVRRWGRRNSVSTTAT